LGLEEQVVCLAVGELDHLVLERRTVARAPAGDGAGVERRSVHGAADHLVRARVRVRDPAVNLLELERSGPVRERLRWIVTRSHLERLQIERRAQQAWRRPGLEPAALETQLGQAL